MVAEIDCRQAVASLRVQAYDFARARLTLTRDQTAASVLAHARTRAGASLQAY
jgi:hypothetical protein